MTQTDYYNLKKPAASDYYNVSDFNDNADRIDAALHGLEEGSGAGRGRPDPAGAAPEMSHAAACLACAGPRPGMGRKYRSREPDRGGGRHQGHRT